MKRIVSLVLCLLLLFTLCVPATAEEDEPIEKKKYVALGDSITAMLNMDYATDNRYPELLAAKNDWDMQSFSHNGWRSNEIRIMLEDDYEADTFDKLFLLIYGGSTLQDLQNYREDLRTAIQNADVITLSIGSNDLMGNLIFDILGHVLIPQGAGVTPLKDMVSATVSSIVSSGNDYIHTLLAAEKTFRINWNHIIHDIRALNPNATIVVFGLYNPFGSVNSEITLPDSILSVVNPFMDSISDYMRYGSPYSREYLFTDISGIDLSGSPDCIHPGPTGHSYIAQQIMTTINDSCKHENVKTLFASHPFLLLPGYTGDVVCADCHELLQHGSLITFTGRHISLPKTIDIDIFMSAKNVLIDVLKILMDASIAW